LFYSFDRASPETQSAAATVKNAPHEVAILLRRARKPAAQFRKRRESLLPLTAPGRRATGDQAPALAAQAVLILSIRTICDETEAKSAATGESRADAPASLIPVVIVRTALISRTSPPPAAPRRAGNSARPLLTRR
jgi:hypothetical protein